MPQYWAHSKVFSTKIAAQKSQNKGTNKEAQCKNKEGWYSIYSWNIQYAVYDRLITLILKENEYNNVCKLKSKCNTSLQIDVDKKGIILKYEHFVCHTKDNETAK